jgi:hypothetical protein
VDSSEIISGAIAIVALFLVMKYGRSALRFLATLVRRA